MDPLAEVRPWESPYLYCGNNPINRVDPTGMIWEDMSEEEDEYGNKRYKAKIRGVVYNNSSSKINMADFLMAVTQQLDEAFNFSGDGFSVVVNTDFRVANSVDDISKTDHVIQIVDQGNLGKNTIADTNIGGLNIRVGSDYTGEIISGGNNRSIAHEMGHTGGLLDVNLNNHMGVTDKISNLMSQSGYIERYGKDRSSSRQLTHDQIRNIWHLGNHGKLNKYSPVRNQLTGFLILPGSSFRPVYISPIFQKVLRK